MCARWNACLATSESVTDFDGVPRTDTTPSAISRSSGEASIMWAAMFITLSRTATVASRVAPPATTAVRLPPVPGPYGVERESATDDRILGHGGFGRRVEDADTDDYVVVNGG